MDKLDKNQILTEVFNEAEQSLNVTEIVGTPSGIYSHLDTNEILKLVYDENTKTIRTINVD